MDGLLTLSNDLAAAVEEEKQSLMPPAKADPRGRAGSALGREAAHSANRIVHVKGDRAGAGVARASRSRCSSSR